MGKLYTVKSVIETVRIDPLGDVIKIHKVSAATVSGDRFTLEIPEAEFSQARVDELLTGRAAMLEAIRKL